MKFLVDEDVAIEIPRYLQHAGHEVVLVYDVLGPRASDAAIWDHAVADNAIVITCNRQDFLRLAGNNPGTGLIILNRRRTRQAECNHLAALLAKAGESGLRRNINVA